MEVDEEEQFAFEICKQERKITCTKIARKFCTDIFLRSSGNKKVDIYVKVKQWGIRVKMYAYRKGGTYPFFYTTFQILQDCDVEEFQNILKALKKTWQKEILSDSESPL